MAIACRVVETGGVVLLEDTTTLTYLLHTGIAHSTTLSFRTFYWWTLITIYCVSPLMISLYTIVKLSILNQGTTTILVMMSRRYES